MEEIFGCSFEAIQRAQQGGSLHQAIDTSKPPTDDSENLPHDRELLAQHGEAKLREMGYFGVLDRLTRAGLLSSLESLPLHAKLAVDRLDADCGLRNSVTLDQLLIGYAKECTEACTREERDAVQAICQSRFGATFIALTRSAIGV